MNIAKTIYFFIRKSSEENINRDALSLLVWGCPIVEVLF
jgi:hypothetical protein